MNINDFENLILAELTTVTENILAKNPSPNISAKARAGAEISDLLEKQFVIEMQNHKYFKNSQSSPEGATKNPWDAMTYFCVNEHEELIWIDFKAVKVSSADSNPDIGTPDKIFNLINQGYFYLAYIFVYYEETANGLEFVKNTDNELVKVYFLKDISSTFRRNPKNQLQVNISAKPEIRTRAEFIKILFEKITESHKRQIEISNKALKKIEESGIKEKLLAENKKQEEKIKKI
jgi:ribosomal protein L28